MPFRHHTSEESLCSKELPMLLLDRYMLAQDSVNEFSGAVLVATKGKVIYQKAFGYADREWRQLNSQYGDSCIGDDNIQVTGLSDCILYHFLNKFPIP